MLLHAALAAPPEPDALRFRRYDVGDGLSNNTVRAFAQDGQGYIWIATRDGLNRFDGQHFRVYRRDRDDPRSLPDNDVRALATSREGELWLGTASGGLAHYDARLDRFDTYRAGAETGLAGNLIRALHFDAQGDLWVSCFGFGVQRFDRERRHATDAPFGRPPQLGAVHAYIDVPEGLLLVGGGGVWRWDRHGRDVQPFLRDAAGAPLQTPFPSGVENVWRDSHGELWVVALGQGLLHFAADGRLLARHISSAGTVLSGSGETRMVIETGDGRLWLGGIDGVALYDRSTGTFVERHTDPTDPTSPAPETDVLFEDRSGLLWFGTFDDGFFVHDPETEAVRIYHRREPLASALPRNMMRALAFEGGAFWVGLGPDGGIAKYAPGRGLLAHYTHAAADPASLADDAVATLAQARDGSLWIGLDTHGLDHLSSDGKTFEHFQHDGAGSLPNNLVNALWIDENDTLWVGTDGGGLASRCPACSEFRSYPGAADDAYDFANATITALAETQDGALWVGTYGGGLLRLDRATGTTRRFAAADSGDAPSNGVVRALRVDARGTLWVGTASGLDRVDTGANDAAHFTHYRGGTWNGRENITCIAEDADAKLWLGTTAGLFRFDPSGATLTQASLLDRRGYEPGACATQGEDLYFGSARGLVAFTPRALPAPHALGALVLDELSLANTPVRPQAGGTLAQTLAFTDHVQLDHRQNVFGIGFSVLDFRDQQDVQVRYRLEGLNEDWIPLPTGQRSVTFSGLPASTYQLRVQAQRDDGAVREAALKLVLAPPPWRSPWAYAAYTLALAALIALIVWRTRARFAYERAVAATIRRSEEELRRLNEELEQRVAQRTSDLSASNAELREALTTLRAAQAQLVESEKLASLGGLVAGVAHEINTPVGVSLTAASHLADETRRLREHLASGELQQGQLDEFQRIAGDGAEIILRNLQRADKLVRSFKQVAVDQTSEEQRKVELGETVDDILTMLGPALRSSPHRVTLVNPQPVQLTSSPGALHQIVANLVQNALLHAFPPGQAGRIDISIKRDNGGAVIEVSDDGVGMTEEVRRHAFEPFFTTRRGHGGSGLGLHIVYNLVTQALKGSIRCDSAPGEGTRFVIRLPVARP